MLQFLLFAYASSAMLFVPVCYAFCSIAILMVSGKGEGINVYNTFSLEKRTLITYKFMFLSINSSL